MSRTLRIGTRGSALALWQADHVAALLSALPGAPTVERVILTTTGDARTDVPLWSVEGRAFFTKEIDRALVSGQVDIAVHSLKDLSTTLEPGLRLGAVLEREDPRDALISATGVGLDALPAGARIGTSSLRRRAFIARRRPDLVTAELRGNVPTRVERVRAGDYDAILLAAAGLKRLGLQDSISAYLSTDQFLPAVSQGAIGICVRDDDDFTAQWVRPLDHADTRIATVAERALLRRLEGGCQVPLGALAQRRGDHLVLRATVCALDGSQELTAAEESAFALDAAIELGERTADALLAQGAGALMSLERLRRQGVAV